MHYCILHKLHLLYCTRCLKYCNNKINKPADIASLVSASAAVLPEHSHLTGATQREDLSLPQLISIGEQGSSSWIVTPRVGDTPVRKKACTASSYRHWVALLHFIVARASLCIVFSCIHCFRRARLHTGTQCLPKRDAADSAPQ